MPIRIVFLSIVATALLTAGCGSVGNASANTSYIQAKYDKDGRLVQLSYDRNKNGHIDTVAFLEGTRFLRIEIDSDENGSVDRWEYYGADQKLEKVGSSKANDGRPDTWAYQDAQGAVVKIEVSTHRDGIVNRTEYYDNGQLARVEEDSDGDGKLDRWESYADGNLRTVAFDTGGRDKPDRRLVYRADGALERLDLDPRGDGTFEAVR
jgi:antitoxin component YwqK of YwqJK toxin-antitoxin module